MLRKRLLVQAKVWTLQSKGTDLHDRSCRAYSELLVLLSEDCLQQKSEVVLGALPPLDDNLSAMLHLDRAVYSELKLALGGTKSCNGGNDEMTDEIDGMYENIVPESKRERPIALRRESEERAPHISVGRYMKYPH